MTELNKEKFANYLSSKNFSPLGIERYIMQIELYESWQQLDDIDEKKTALDVLKLWTIHQDIELSIKENIERKLQEDRS